MPTPSIGRTVLVYVDPATNGGTDIAPATITHVWNDGLVNVRVTNNGPQCPPLLTSIALFPDQASAEASDDATYTPYPDERRIPFAAFWPPHI